MKTRFAYQQNKKHLLVSTSIIIALFFPVSASSLSLSDIAHGEQQLQKLISDRPAIAGFDKPDGAIYRWIVLQFAGEALGSKIYWNPAIPKHGLMGCSNVQSQSQTPAIQMVKGDDREKLLMITVYELFNIRNSRPFDGLWDSARKRRINRYEWTVRNCELEFTAMLQTKLFFKKIWLPHAAKNHLTATPELWRMDEPDDFQDWLHGPDGQNYANYWNNAYPEIDLEKDDGLILI